MADDPTPPDHGSDWLDRLLDDDFVNEAFITEPSAAERAAEAARQRRVQELNVRLGDDVDSLSSSRRRRRRRRLRSRVVGLVVVAALVVTGVTLNRVNGGSAVGSPSLHSGIDDLAAVSSSNTARPTPTPGAGSPLGEPPAVPTRSGKYKFIAMQPSGAAPVAYDPCRPIHYVVNTANEPPGGQQLITDAFTRLGAATGLKFISDGSTSETPGERRDAFQPDRYGDKWAPVAIWWATPDTAPRLSGAVAGYAASTSIDTGQVLGAPIRTFVSGIVVLDGPQLAMVETSSRAGRAGARSVILHELGHLVGLDHVDDPTQIMNPESSGQVTAYAAGDLRGLNELGRGTCVVSL